VNEEKNQLQNNFLKIRKQNSEINPYQCSHLTTMAVTDP